MENEQVKLLEDLLEKLGSRRGQKVKQSLHCILPEFLPKTENASPDPTPTWAEL
jgi:hypothetical protein